MKHYTNKLLHHLISRYFFRCDNLDGFCFPNLLLLYY